MPALVRTGHAPALRSAREGGMAFGHWLAFVVASGLNAADRHGGPGGGVAAGLSPAGICDYLRAAGIRRDITQGGFSAAATTPTKRRGV